MYGFGSLLCGLGWVKSDLHGRGGLGSSAIGYAILRNRAFVFLVGDKLLQAPTGMCCN